MLARGELILPSPQTEALPEGVLALLREVLREYHFYGQYGANAVTADGEPCARSAFLVGVATHDGRPALLERALDPTSGQIEVNLWAPGAFGSALVDDLFDDSAVLEGQALSIHVIWAAGRRHRDVTVLLLDEPATRVALAAVTEVGLETRRIEGDPQAMAAVLAAVLADGLA